MTALKATIVGALLGVRGIGPDDEVPEKTRELAEQDADAVIAALPDNAGLDFIRVFESWGERETNLTSTMLDLAIAATLLHASEFPGTGDEMEIEITTADLRSVVEDWRIERTEKPGGWCLKLSRITPK